MIDAKYPLKLSRGEKLGWTPHIVDAEGKKLFSLESLLLDKYYEPVDISGIRSDWFFAKAVVAALNALYYMPKNLPSNV